MPIPNSIFKYRMQQYREQIESRAADFICLTDILRLSFLLEQRFINVTAFKCALAKYLRKQNFEFDSASLDKFSRQLILVEAEKTFRSLYRKSNVEEVGEAVSEEADAAKKLLDDRWQGRARLIRRRDSFDAYITQFLKGDYGDYVAYLQATSAILSLDFKCSLYRSISIFVQTANWDPNQPGDDYLIAHLLQDINMAAQQCERELYNMGFRTRKPPVYLSSPTMKPRGDGFRLFKNKFPGSDEETTTIWHEAQRLNQRRYQFSILVRAVKDMNNAEPRSHFVSFQKICAKLSLFHHENRHELVAEDISRFIRDMRSRAAQEDAGSFFPQELLACLDVMDSHVTRSPSLVHKPAVRSGVPKRAIRSYSSPGVTKKT